MEEVDEIRAGAHAEDHRGNDFLTDVEWSKIFRRIFEKLHPSTFAHLLRCASALFLRLRNAAGELMGGTRSNGCRHLNRTLAPKIK